MSDTENFFFPLNTYKDIAHLFEGEISIFTDKEVNRQGGYMDLSWPTYRGRSCEMGTFGADVTILNSLITIHDLYPWNTVNITK